MPKRLGFSELDAETVKSDRKEAKRIGPCAVGQKALYLNSYFLDCHYYLPISSVKRVFKRIAMSQGGFSGSGLFGALPYLVVEYDDGRQRQFRFKHEEDIDRFLELVEKRWPKLPTHSVAAEKRLAEKAAALAARPRPQLSDAAKTELVRAQNAQKYLEQHPAQTNELAAAAKAKRVNQRVNPAYKWVALAITLGGIVALALGIKMLVSSNNIGIYLMLFGMAAILFFSGKSVLPTARNNKKAVETRLEKALAAANDLAGAYPDLPVPGRYAHPIVLERMAEAILEGRAETCESALELVKTDLKALTAEVQVEQEEYDQVVVIKPLFLVADYQ